MDQEDSDDHTHCKTCYRATCGTKGRVLSNCLVIVCALKCGARFHSCKAEEHKDACELEKVKCINSVNGCPLIIQRNKLGVHLERCPASVVYCTMEWNRWPIYSHERQSRVPFVGDNLHAQYGQLDVALALRDQRMLNQAMKAPRSTRRALRNNLTQRFPAVPIQLTSNTTESIASGSSSRTDSNEDVYPRKNVEYPPGLERSICNALFRANRKAVEHLTAPRKGSKDIGTNTACCAKDEDEGIGGEEVESCIDNSIKCYAAEPSNGADIKEIEEKSSEKESDKDIGVVDKEIDTNTEKANSSVLDNRETEDPDVYDGGDLKKGVAHIPAPPCIAPLNPLKETLALDLNLESITRYQAKPRSMYTFLCAQEFRRDEYWGHFKNVHDMIHSGLNGWLEQRCPLAQYGCTYSLRRLYAGEKGAEIVHNDILESFGVKPHLPTHQRDQPTLAPEDILLGKEKNILSKEYLASTEKLCQTEWNDDFNEKSDLILNDQNKEIEELDNRINDLSGLPFEVLRYMALFLDSYSLCNLALTCRTLREVACSLLEEKGIVIQQWEKRMVNGRPSWDISHKRWIYSTSFTSVKQWGFEDYKPIGDHLKNCPFYHRAHVDMPHHLPSIKCGHHHSNNFYEIMKRMYPNFIAHHNEGEPACTAGAGLC